MGSKYATYLILLAAASVKILEQNGIIFTNIKKKAGLSPIHMCRTTNGDINRDTYKIYRQPEEMRCTRNIVASAVEAFHPL